MSKENELGTLIVVVLKARNLNDKHSFYKQDVFAQVSLNGATKRTQVDVKGGQHPVWDAELRFPVLKNTAEKHRKLEVSCYCKERKSDDILGTGTVDITDTLKTGEFDDWVPLNVEGVVRGDIYLEMTFYTNTPAGPAPAATLAAPVNQDLTRRPSKLPPSDRLYRAPQNLGPSSARPSHTTPKVHQHPGTSTSHSGGKPSLRPSPSPSPKRSESPLPPRPEETISALPLPQILIPRGGQTQPRPSDQHPPQVPSILRPRNEISSPTHSYLHAAPAAPKHDTSTPLPYRDNHYGATLPPVDPYTRIASPALPSPYLPATTPPTYNPIFAPSRPTSEYSTPPPRVDHYTPSPSAAPAAPYPPSTIPPTGAPNFVPSGPATYMPFPTPTIPPLQQSDKYPVPEPQPFRHRPPNEDDFPDPYLQARYQTPLPLPPGATRPHTIQTTPPQTWNNPDNRSNLDNRLIDALRLEEEVALRHKSQEEKDLELALQLDRELNSAS